MIEQKVLEAYADGSPISIIADSFKISERLTKDILIKYRENNRTKRAFTNEFRKMIAERDLNGVARSTIANELGLNINTVKKACEKFGQAIKERATSDQTYTRIDGEFSLKKCPSCGSKKNNLVDDKTTYCKNCGAEHEYYDGYVKKVNWEYIEE